MPALLLVAVALGLSNLAAAVGLGVSGMGARARLRVGLVFGVFETGMPLAGLLLGHGLAHALGHTARWIGAAVLVACGGYALVQASRHRAGDGGPTSPLGAGRLLLTGLALSLDNLAVGFALGAYHVALLLAVVVIGTVSVALSLLGLELGARLRARTGDRGEQLSGLILIAVGIALACGVT
jgi:putative Mn2+ efflux pump MntP